MAQRKISLRQLAEKMGLAHSALSITFSGSRRMQLEEAAQLSNIFGVPVHEIIENAGVSMRPFNSVRVSVVGALRGDGHVEQITGKHAERTSAPPGLPEGTAAIQARTADTPLSWLDGAVFFFVPSDSIHPDAIGRLCYLKIHDGEHVIAMMKRGYRDHTYNLSGLHQKENVKVDWATPIRITRN
ncbi:transcriptional regulator [Ralstonia phage UAM5]|nr:transcriptional regulator [Ralstonia phage UAM5]